ncbi:MAG: DEAD/DEAH box helicase family protein [Betaproteobacteria bacterium]|nr:DEAD/DEAH box helicase family protein [Betaproteobacteria bacterium]
MSPMAAKNDANPFGIAPYSAAKLTRLFECLPGIDRVWIYGSRARGDHREESDIDLAVEAASEEAYSGAWRAVEALELVYRVDLVHLQRVSDTGFRSRIDQDKKVFWEPRSYATDVAGLAGTELKQFQREVLAQLARYIEELEKQRGQAERAAEALRAAEVDADKEMLDFARKTWDAMRERKQLPPTFAGRTYSSRFDPAARPIPNVCLKVPTGGGKTLLAAAAVARMFSSYFRRHTGLVLWIVPNEAIFSQTKRTLNDRDHPYRQMLNVAGAGRVKILEKDSPLSRADVESHLCVMLLMLQSASRQSKETLRFFRDRGSVHGFFPREDDLDAHYRLLGEIPNLDIYGADPRLKGAIVKDSLGNVMRLVRPMVIIDEGHHAYTETALKTIDGFNPSLVLELSATPRVGKKGEHGANILVDVRGTDLERAEMIKLPINVEARPWNDWQSCLNASVSKLDELGKAAHLLEADTARYIRPILLVQVERTGADQHDSGFIHADDARNHLLQLGFHADEIAIKTADRDELKQVENINLLSPANRVRAIVTKQALSEGWDCPFAYVLCALSAGRNPAALTQLIGRILRQPDVAKTGRSALDECYVFCHDIQTGAVVTLIKSGLEQDGLGDLAISVRSGNGEAPNANLRKVERNPKFGKLRIFLPRVTWNDGGMRRELAYDSDILAKVPWQAMDAAALANDWAPDSAPAGQQRLRIGLEVLAGVSPILPPDEDSISASLDRVSMVRAVLDLVPNAWIVWQLIETTVRRLQRIGFAEQAIARSSNSLIERLRSDLERERDRLAEQVFTELVEAGRVAFSLRADAADYELPSSLEINVSDSPRNAQRPDGQPIDKSLFQPCFEAIFDNRLELDVACYLDSQAALTWWHRNVAKTQYGLQGWKRNKIYPDFVFAKMEGEGMAKIVVLETKGLHLKNEDSAYKKALLDRLTEIYMEGSGIRVGELALEGTSRQQVICDLVFDDAWRGAISSRHFSS